MFKDPKRQYQCDFIYFGKRCTKVQWRNRARDPNKQNCDDCCDFINMNNPLYKRPRRYIRREPGKPLTEKEKRRIYKQKHPKYPCRVCNYKYRTDRHPYIKGKDGTKGFCKGCYK